ncbi:MAG TPA: ThiF family adenylyltransferase [Mycobacteriales bacterium]|nr:ThiF family adenylyltransferase [Mycobacteriales bacterium]
MTEPDHTEPRPALEQVRVAAAVALDAFRDALAGAGFRRLPGGAERWRGLLDTSTVPDLPAPSTGVGWVTVVEIEPGPEFPFAMPSVRPLEKAYAEAVMRAAYSNYRAAYSNYHEAGHGWHRNGDGGMCLFIEADHTRLPWADGVQLLEQATAWVAHDAAGWPGPEPALDLERYLPATADTRLIVYSDLTGEDGRPLRLRPQRNDILRVTGRAAPTRAGGRGGQHRWPDDTAFVVNVGRLGAPIRDWAGLLGLLDADTARQLERSVDQGLRRVLVRYERHDTVGVLALRLTRPATGAPLQLAYQPTAPDDATTRLLRAHPAAARLSDYSVAVVGIGSIGSNVADLLHRSGVGTLHLLDGERLVPGNPTRHLLDDSYIGRPKSLGVQTWLREHRPTSHTTVTAAVGSLTTIEDAITLLAGCDLVVDATADSTASALLAATARNGGGQLLSACVLADGYAVRVDRIPTRRGDTPVPTPRLPARRPEKYETGCGSPVSTTPPAAVWHAAALAAHHAIRLLLEPDQVPAGEMIVLEPQTVVP